jgi:hypothetical protein
VVRLPSFLTRTSRPTGSSFSPADVVGAVRALDDRGRQGLHREVGWFGQDPRREHREHADAALAVDLQQVVAAGVGHHLGVVADQQPVGVGVDPGHGADAVHVDLEQLAEAAGARAEQCAGGGVEEIAEQQVALRPDNPRSTGPVAATPPASETDGRPVSTRCWECLVILVTAPVGPKQDSPPSGPAGMHGPVPPDPDSATSIG